VGATDTSKLIIIVKTLRIHQVITYVVFAVLLVTRVSGPLIALLTNIVGTGMSSEWIDSLDQTVRMLYAFFLLGSYPLIAVVITINRDDLKILNMDKPFVLIFIFLGLTIFWTYISPFDWIAGIATILMFYLLLKGKLNFGNTDPNVLRIILVVIGMFVLGLWMATSLLNMPMIEQKLYLFFYESIPTSIYEEVIYRGILWMLLRNLNWSEPKILLFQVFLFWVSHLHFLFRNPVQFWIFTPIVSLLLGYIVLRSKSITPSAIAHVLINLFQRLILS